jgi:serine protease SohB
VVLELDSGGGTVTGYGFAAAQLERLKAAGLPLTICVTEVAASGGYMMACTADRLVAGPLAILGSIGVITDIPNVYERLKKEGVVFNTVTAGKYKRQLTPTKQTTDKDLAKTKQDLEDILTLFKGFVKRNRPKLDIDDVATGEIWFGPDALEKKLCDELATVDEVLMGLVQDGHDVFQVTTSAARPTFIDDLGLELDDDATARAGSNYLRAAASAAATAAGAAAGRAVLSGLSANEVGGAALGRGLNGGLQATDGLYLNRFGLDGRRGAADANGAMLGSGYGGGGGGGGGVDDYGYGYGYSDDGSDEGDWPML